MTATVRFLEFLLLDPVDRALATAPVEDEAISEEEEQAVARSKEWFQHNEGIPFGLAATDLGFTMEQIRSLRSARLPSFLHAQYRAQPALGPAEKGHLPQKRRDETPVHVEIGRARAAF